MMSKLSTLDNWTQAKRYEALRVSECSPRLQIGDGGVVADPVRRPGLVIGTCKQQNCT